MKKDNFEVIKGVVRTIFEDFDTGEPIIKSRAVAFLLEIDSNSEKSNIIVVYDKDAIRLGLIKVGEPLTCLGWRDGTIIGIDSKGLIAENQRFLCRGIMGDADITEELLTKEGAIRLR